MPNYVNNKDFLKILLDFQEKRKKDPNYPFPEELVNTFQKMIDKIATRHNFFGYKFIDDMKQEAMYFCLKAATKFDPEKSQNPFAYFTSVIWNAFISVIMKEKKYIDFKFDYAKFFMTEKQKKRDYRINEEILDELTKINTGDVKILTDVIEEEM